MEAVLFTSQAVKRAEVEHPIHPLLQERWSPRAFDGRAVERAKMRSLFEAARWSASSGNKQPWSFLVAEQGEATHEKVLSILNTSNAEWATKAPVLMVVVARTRNEAGELNPYGYYDTGLAVQNLTVQATALGLYVHQMGGFSAERARATFAIPEDYQAIVVAAIGYLGDPLLLPEQRREAELTPRTRKSLREFTFTEEWGRTAGWIDES